MDHLLTDYAVQIRNRMQNQAERALSQAKKNSQRKRIRLLRSISIGSYFSKILVNPPPAQRIPQSLLWIKN